MQKLGKKNVGHTKMILSPAQRQHEGAVKISKGVIFFQK